MPFWLLTLAVFVFLIVSVTLMDGMFVDGVVYACVGRNLANGIGTFWEPRFSETYWSHFHIQPPLMFGLEAGFFKVLGNTIYTERVYSICTAILSAAAMILVWNLFSKERPHQSVGWFPLLCWITMPTVFWVYQNNLEEGTVTVFVLLSVYFILRAILYQTSSIFWLCLGGAGLCLASLCKGIQGLFPLSLPLVAYLTYHQKYRLRKALLFTIIPCAIVFIFYSILFSNGEIRYSFQQYAQTRLVRTFAGTHNTTTNRLLLLHNLGIEILPVVLLLLFLWSVGGRRLDRTQLRAALLMILLALTGILPLMVTLEQRRFYFAPALPLFVIGMWLPFAKNVSRLLEPAMAKPAFRILSYAVSLLLLCGGIIFTATHVGKPKRDVTLLGDVHLIGKITGHNAVIGANSRADSRQAFTAYLVRYYYVSIEMGTTSCLWYVSTPAGAIPPDGFEEVSAGLRTCRLYRRKMSY